jgi:anti-sigma factor ChrR (cupin superfamily)
MTHSQCEQTSLYALGVLDGEELAAFEQHLGAGCANCQKELERFNPVVDQLGCGSISVDPPSSLRDKILGRIHQQAISNGKQRLEKSQDEDSRAGLTFVKATDDSWQEVAPGILLKPLYMDTQHGRMTALARMASGANYVAHRHTAPEEFYILEGSCFCGGQLLRVGDYHRAEVGSVHHETSSQEGCLMLIIFSPNNEMLEPTQA